MKSREWVIAYMIIAMSGTPTSFRPGHLATKSGMSVQEVRELKREVAAALERAKRANETVTSF